MIHTQIQDQPALLIAIKQLEKLNPDHFEVYFENSKSTKIDAKDQEIETLTRSEDVGIAIRLIRDHRPGFSYTTSLEPQAICKAADTAFEIARYMPEDTYAGLHGFDSTMYPNVDNFDISGVEIPLQKKIELAKKLENHCRKSDKRIKAVRQATITESLEEVHMVDSNGEHIFHKSTGYTASVTCKAEESGDSQIGSDFGFSNYLDTLSLDTIGTLAARWAVELLGSTSAPTMKCPAILRNSVVVDLIDFLSSSFSAEEVDKGRSMLAGKQGQLVFSDQVTLIEDGLMPGGMGTLPFDAEGIPSQVNTLVDGGFISTFLYDLRQAKKSDAKPTGSSVRGLKSPPSIGFSNIYLQKGRQSFDDLLDGVTKGILITDLMGVHTANPITGDFSLGASGILIENGKLTKPVRGFAVAGNILELFRRITDIGNDTRFFGRIGAPSVRIGEISVGGA